MKLGAVRSFKMGQPFKMELDKLRLPKHRWTQLKTFAINMFQVARDNNCKTNLGSKVNMGAAHCQMIKQSHEKGDNFQTETTVLDLVPAGWSFLKSRHCFCPNLITFFISRRRYRTSLEVLVRVHTLRIISLVIKHWFKYEINDI